MYCIIISKPNIQTDVIKKVLDEFKIASKNFNNNEFSLSDSFVSQPRETIKKADFIIIVYSENSPNLLFEIGYCIGLNKRIFLVLPVHESLPSNLSGLVYVRSNVDEYNKIKHAFESFLRYYKLLGNEKNEQFLFDNIKNGSSNQNARLELSRMYQKQKRWHDAEITLKDLLVIEPANIDARFELSKVYQQQKKWNKAEDILKESLALEPEQLYPRVELSKIYQQQKKWKEAEVILKESLELDPEQLHPRTELSKIYQQQKKWEEAEDILKESLAISPDQLYPRIELSRIYQQQKKWKEAEDILKESLELDPGQLHPRTELSKVYQQQKKWEEAEDILKESLAISPDQLYPRIELSKIYQQQKKWEKAEMVLLETLEFDIYNEKARLRLNELYILRKSTHKLKALSKGEIGKLELLNILEKEKTRVLYALKQKVSSLTRNSSKLIFEEIITALFKILNIQVFKEKNSPNKIVDFSIWVDELSNTIGNPIIVELKFGVSEEKQFENSILSLSNFVNKTNSKAAILIYHNPDTNVPDYRTAFLYKNVYVVTLNELLSRLIKSPFHKIILEIRENGMSK